MSQWIRATSTPKVAIACVPTEPTIPSRCGATASRALPILSSLRTSGDRPRISSTAQSLAQSSTWTSGVGELRRLAISASIT